MWRSRRSDSLPNLHMVVWVASLAVLSVGRDLASSSMMDLASSSMMHELPPVRLWLWERTSAQSEKSEMIMAAVRMRSGSNQMQPATMVIVTQHCSQAKPNHHHAPRVGPNLSICQKKQLELTTVHCIGLGASGPGRE